MRSPCKNFYGPGKPCQFLNIQKNNDACGACKRRLEYINYIEGNPFPAGIAYVKIKQERKTMKDPKSKVCSGIYCPKGEKSQPIENFDVNASSKAPFLLCRACKTAEQVCKLYDVDLADIRGGQALKSPARTNAVQEIVEKMRELDVPVVDIAILMGISQAAVYSRLERNKVSKPKDSVKEDFTLTHMPQTCCHGVKDKPKSDNKYAIELDFSNHQDVFNDLVDVAERQLRDPAMQALFVLRYVYEKGLKISEQIQRDD